MLRPILLTAVVVISGCKEPARPSVVPAALAKADAPTAAPDVVAAVRTIYEGYAKNPNGYDRTPVLSRFYVEDNGRIDRECQDGAKHRQCTGDRFSCVAVPPKKAGTVVDAIAKGGMPGVSASVQVTMAFGTMTTKADVDVVYEGGAWKIDQVRCD